VSVDAPAGSGPAFSVRVRYTPWLPWLFGATSAINLVTCFVAGAPMQAALAILTGGLAAAYALNPMVELTSAQLRLKNAWGMTLQTLAYRGVADLEIEGRTLWIRMGRADRRKVSGRIAHAGDWARLAATIAAAQGAPPAATA
jgi:hypothetical protein